MASRLSWENSERWAGVALQVLGLLMVVSAPYVDGQVAGGTIQGTVADTSGRVIPEAKVSIKNVATNVLTSVEDNDDGFYTAPNLLPGTYHITCSAKGFSSAELEGVTLTVGAQQRVNFTLKPGTVTEVIEVHDLPPTVDLTTSTLSNVVGSTTVRELPLNGRDWTQLATLEIGVNQIRTQVALSTGPDRGNRGYGTQLTISGGRPAQNNYRLDGVSINDYSNGAPGSVLGSNLGVDAVEEFSVLTSNYSAEYGRTSGGVVNAVTKSGTNSFHGTAYEFLRNSALDARNFFDTGAKKPPFRRNQFGASAGGPIVKQRTFLFGDYEGDRQATNLSTPITVPSQNQRNGTTDPVIKQYLNFFPIPLGTDPTANGFTSVVDQVTNEDYFTLRGDHRLTKKDNLVGTYVYDKAATTQPDILNSVLTGNSTKRQIVTAEDTHTFTPTVLNTVRFGFNRVAAFAGQNVKAINPLATNTSIGSVPGRPAPGINFGDGTVSFPGGLGASPNYRFHWNSFQFYDDAFVTKGVHFLKFGFATEYIQDNILASSDANGVVVYSTLDTFLSNGTPSRFDAAVPGIITERQIRQHIYATYIQDDVRWKPNLTVNLGLRYELSTVPSDTHGRLSTLRNLTDAQPHLGSPFFYNPTYHNFEPRVGFAWDPFRTGKTSVRAGYGMFDVLPLPYLFELLFPLTAPFYQLETSSSLPANAFPGGLFPLISVPSNLRQAFVDPHPKRNYAMQWNLNVQRELTKNLTGLVAYVGSRAVHQAFRADDVNTTLPNSLTSRTPVFPGYDPNTGASLGTLLNPNAGQISSVMWSGDAHYNALQAKLSAKASSLQAQASYTWGKSIDTGSATVGGDTFTNSISSLPFFNPALRRGPSDFNVTHNLTISYNWSLPRPQRFAAPANWFLGGWQLGGVVQVNSGIPFTPNIGGDALGLLSTDPWDFPDRISGPGCGSLVNSGNPGAYIKTQCLAAPSPTNRRGNLGRNSLVGPPLRNVDFSLVKNSPVKGISDTFNIQFRAEMFNIFNHPNFLPPIDHASVLTQDGVNPSLLDPIPLGNLSNPGAGTIDQTATFSRQIQFGLKFIW